MASRHATMITVTRRERERREGLDLIATETVAMIEVATIEGKLVAISCTYTSQSITALLSLCYAI